MLVFFQTIIISVSKQLNVVLLSKWTFQVLHFHQFLVFDFILLMSLNGFVKQKKILANTQDCAQAFSVKSTIPFLGKWSEMWQIIGIRKHCANKSQGVNNVFQSWRIKIEAAMIFMYDKYGVFITVY